MRVLFSQSSIDAQAARTGPLLIGAGLGLLFIASRWAAAPLATGMAFVALGATIATIARFRRMVSLPMVAAANLFVYSSLYLLFVAAVWHAAVSGPRGRLAFVQGLDLGVSAMVMAVAVCLSVRSIAAKWDAPAR